ncbi:hypothetical protein [Demequina mangrovi]|uniref:Leucine rich repeat variant n=1 Tax=Demequina mangrovi TaxID=1043493 RepID=A0A1H6YE41_9MICO|nr:hypothetical protein [Demequina mangrovi]SEJ35005.1 hypothetical protein SAMN05421637_1515 [Demequina mangrovi]
MFSDSNAQQTARQSAQKAIPDGISDGELATLSRSPEAKVRAAVAAHAGTPLMTLLRLAEDRSTDVRIGLARNRRVAIPIEVREDLAKDKNVDVVYALIENPAVPEQLIAKLGRQIHKEYAKAARARLAAMKAGTWSAPDAEAPAAAPAAALPEVPAFPPTVQAPAAPAAPAAPHNNSARADALDILLGDSKR